MKNSTQGVQFPLGSYSTSNRKTLFFLSAKFSELKHGQVADRDLACSRSMFRAGKKLGFVFPFSKLNIPRILMNYLPKITYVDSGHIYYLKYIDQEPHKSL